MMNFRSGLALPRVAVLCTLGLLTACSQALVAPGVPPSAAVAPGTAGAINLFLSSKAITDAKATRARGGRLWCVPFARTMSGIDLRGDARLWWNAAEGIYARGSEPQVGAVMVFSGSKYLKRGHIAVVSRILSDREILVDHANWKRNEVTLNSKVIDVSEAGDWSAVRVEMVAGSPGRVNPIAGFIYPQRLDGPV